MAATGSNILYEFAITDRLLERRMVTKRFGWDCWEIGSFKQLDAIRK